MNDNILEFLEIYKNLDKLCREILSSDRGISGYIDEMSYVNQRYRVIDGWERDYKQLKKMRWIRNRLVHEADSFEEDLVNGNDIEWLHIFYCRIMECRDPLALLHQSENMNRTTGKNKKYSECYYSTNQTSPSQNENIPARDIILLGIIFILVVGIVFCFLENI